MSDPQLHEKPHSYYEQARPELVALLPAQLGRVLDVGCGAGGVGRTIRDRADSLVGIEPDPRAAAEAEEVYDSVVVGAVEDALPGLAGPFDTVLVTTSSSISSIRSAFLSSFASALHRTLSCTSRFRTRVTGRSSAISSHAGRLATRTGAIVTARTCAG